MSEDLGDLSQGSEALFASIANGGGRDLVAESLELGLDSVLDDGLLRDVPVVGWAVKGVGVAAALRERFFARKLLSFIGGTDTADAVARRRFLEQLDDPKERRRVGETLLVLIDRHERVEKSFILGRLVAATIEGHLTGARLMELSTALERATVEELVHLRQLDRDPRPDSLDVVWTLSRSGVITMSFNAISAGVVAPGWHINPLGRDLLRFGIADLSPDLG